MNERTDEQDIGELSDHFVCVVRSIMRGSDENNWAVTYLLIFSLSLHLVVAIYSSSVAHHFDTSSVFFN